MHQYPQYLRIGLDHGGDELHAGDEDTVVPVLQHVCDPLHEILHVLWEVAQDADAAQGSLNKAKRERGHKRAKTPSSPDRRMEAGGQRGHGGRGM